MVLDCSTTSSSNGEEEPQDSPTDLCDPQNDGVLLLMQFGLDSIYEVYDIHL